MFKQDIEDWINGYLSERVPEHNNLARCPFAQKSLNAGKIHFVCATSQEQAIGMVESETAKWDDDTHDVIVLELDWNLSDDERIGLKNLFVTHYGVHKDFLFIEERQMLNGHKYDFILIHRFSEMQVAKRQLKRKGYYQ